MYIYFFRFPVKFCNLDSNFYPQPFPNRQIFIINCQVALISSKYEIIFKNDSDS